MLVSGLLLALDVLAWPLFYLLLQSYVSEWPGVMCVYGVTRIGSGSMGPARFLPALLATLQAVKPLVVFTGGAWLVLHLLNRQTRTGPLTGRVVAVILASALLALADAAAEAAYLAIPKKEDHLSGGCCLSLLDTASGPSRFLPAGLLGGDARPWLHAAYFAVNAGLIVGLAGAARASRRGTPVGWLAPICCGAMLCIGVNALYLSEVAAPRLLRMPATTAYTT